MGGWVCVEWVGAEKNPVKNNLKFMSYDTFSEKLTIKKKSLYNKTGLHNYYETAIHHHNGRKPD